MARTINWKRPSLVRRFANSVRAFAEPANPKPDLRGELGITGDTVQSGLPVDPYNPTLAGKEWFLKVDEMVRAGGQAHVIGEVISLPIIAAEWDVTGASQELVDLVKGNLIDDNADPAMSTTWPDVLRRACLSALYGTWAMEKVWEEQDGKVVIRRLPDRMPHSILRYEIDKTGTLTGVTQLGSDATGQTFEVEVPIDRLLIFPYRKTGNNWHGLSVLRPAYLHWFCVQTLYRLAAIGIERSLVNTPIGILPSHYTEADKTAFLRLLEGIRRNEASGIALPPGYDIKDGSKIGSSDKVGFLDLIEHHTAWIVRCALADFAILGESARALGDVKINFFLMAWEAFANELQATFNRHLVRQMVRYNAPSATGADVPRITHTPIGLNMRIAQTAEFLTALINGKVIIPDYQAKDENWFRTMLGLPQRQLTPEEEKARLDASLAAAGYVPGVKPDFGLDSAVASQNQQVQTDTAAAPPTPDAARPPSPAPASAAPKAFAEAAVPASAAKVDAQMTAAEDAWQQAGRQQLTALFDSLLQQLAAAGSDPAAEEAITVPPALIDGYAAWILEWLTAAQDVAWSTMEAEVGQAVAKPADLAATLAARARAIAVHHAESARFEVVMDRLHGQSPDAIRAAFEQAMSGRLRTDLAAEGQALAAEVSSGGR